MPSARRSSGSAGTRPSTASAGSSRGSSPSSSCPLYTHYLGPGGLREDRDDRRADDGARDRAADGDLERLLPLLLRHEGRGAPDARRPHVLLVHDDDGDGGPGRRLDPRRRRSPTRSRSATTRGSSAPAFVGLWAQMNYEQLTSLFRVEERSTQFVLASVANVLITVGMTVLLVVGLHKGATGAVVGNFIGTLCVYVVLLAYRRYQLGLQFSRSLLRADEPLRDAARPVGARAVGDQLHRPDLHRAVQGPGRGRRLLGRGADLVGGRLPDDRVPARLARVRVLDRGRPRGEADVRVRAHLPAVPLLVDLARARRARAVARPPARARARASRAPPTRSRCSRSPPPPTPATPWSRSASAARARRSSTGSSAGSPPSVNIGLNFALIPPYGMIGAAIATLAAYLTLFGGMVLNSQPRLPGRLPVAAGAHARRRRRRR